MRTHLLIGLCAATIATATEARADPGVAVGVFVGEPTGLDLKLGLDYRSSLDIVLGWDTYRDNRDGYAHVTYLATLAVAHGDAVSIPIRLGIGGAVYSDGSFDAGTNFAVRVPFEVGLRFHRAPIELYGELALKLTLIDDNSNNDDIDLDGGVGMRVYF